MKLQIWKVLKATMCVSAGGCVKLIDVNVEKHDFIAALNVSAKKVHVQTEIFHLIK